MGTGSAAQRGRGVHAGAGLVSLPHLDLTASAAGGRCALSTVGRAEAVPEVGGDGERREASCGRQPRPLPSWAALAPSPRGEGQGLPYHGANWAHVSPSGLYPGRSSTRAPPLIPRGSAPAPTHPGSSPGGRSRPRMMRTPSWGGGRAGAAAGGVSPLLIRCMGSGRQGTWPLLRLNSDMTNTGLVSSPHRSPLTGKRTEQGRSRPAPHICWVVSVSPGPNWRAGACPRPAPLVLSNRHH